jgi:hypothetical protein
MHIELHCTGPIFAFSLSLKFWITSTKSGTVKRLGYAKSSPTDNGIALHFDTLTSEDEYSHPTMLFDD